MLGVDAIHLGLLSQRNGLKLNLLALNGPNQKAEVTAYVSLTFLTPVIKQHSESLHSTNRIQDTSHFVLVDRKHLDVQGLLRRLDEGNMRNACKKHIVEIVQ